MKGVKVLTSSYSESENTWKPKKPQNCSDTNLLNGTELEEEPTLQKLNNYHHSIDLLPTQACSKLTLSKSLLIQLMKKMMMTTWMYKEETLMTIMKITHKASQTLKTSTQVPVTEPLAVLLSKEWLENLTNQKLTSKFQWLISETMNSEPLTILLDISKKLKKK